MMKKYTLLSLLLIGTFLFPNFANAEEIQRSTCEMTIKSSHTMDSPANANGDCNGLVFGFYSEGQDTFRTFGMSRYDVEYSGQQFIVATPSGQHAEAVLTVYTVKEATKPPVEEPKEDNKPTQPVEQPKEEPKDPPKTEQPKEESKPNTSTQEPKENSNSKPSTSQKEPSTNESQSDSSNNETVVENKQEQDGDSSDDSSTTNEDEPKEEVDETDKEQEETVENQKIRDLLQKNGSEIGRVVSEMKKTELASYEIENESTKSGFIAYVVIGISIVLLGGVGFWYYKRKVS
jgi:hypothetical protein